MTQQATMTDELAFSQPYGEQASFLILFRKQLPFVMATGKYAVFRPIYRIAALKSPVLLNARW